MRKKGKNHWLRLVLFAFYLMIILMPIAVFVSTYANSFQFSVEQEKMFQNQLTMNGIQIVTNSLQLCDTYAIGISSQSQFINYHFTSAQPSNRLAERICNLRDSLPYINDPNGLIYRYYIYSANSDTIVDQQSGYLNPRLVYQALFALSGYDYDTLWATILNNTDARDFIPALDENGRSTMLYSRLLRSGKNPSRIIFYVDMQKMISCISGGSVHGQTSFTLCDADGSILYQSDEQKSLANFSFLYNEEKFPCEITADDGKKEILFANSLSEYGWTLYTSVPVDYFISYALEMSLNTMKNLLPLLLLQIIFTILLIRHSYIPIRTTLSKLGSSQEILTVNPFKHVQHSLNQLSSVNEKQQIMLSRSRLEMQEAILSMLIYQKRGYDFPLEKRLHDYGLYFDGDYYRALVLMLFDTESGEALQISERMHMMICEISKEYTPCLRYLKMDAADEMLFLAVLEDEKGRTEQLQNDLNALCSQISETFLVNVHIYIGNECDELEQVHSSFKNAHDLCQACSTTDKYLIFSSPHSTPIYDYKESDVKYLQQMTLAGQTEAVCSRLKEIYLRNSGEHARSAFERQLLYGHMISTLLATGYQEPLDELITKGFSDLSVKHFFELLSQYYSRLCQNNLDQEHQETQQLKADILAALKEEIGNYNANQADVAMRFGMTERRFAVLLRQETGLSFSKYMEKIRLEYACDLLKREDLTIEEIAQQIGYGSDKSFRRAFKQAFGTSPSAYRP